MGAVGIWGILGWDLGVFAPNFGSKPLGFGGDLPFMGPWGWNFGLIPPFLSQKIPILGCSRYEDPGPEVQLSEELPESLRSLRVGAPRGLFGWKIPVFGILGLPAPRDETHPCAVRIPDFGNVKDLGVPGFCCVDETPGAEGAEAPEFWAGGGGWFLSS